MDEKPDNYIQMMLDKASDGLEAFKLILDPDHVEKAQVLMEIILQLL